MNVKNLIGETRQEGVRNMMKNRRRRGFSLLELAMVLAIGVLIAVGVMMFYQQANNSRSAQNAVTQLGAIQQAVRAVYGGQSTYTGLTNTILVQTKQLPVSMVSGTAGIRSAFSTAITVAAADSGGGANSGFSIKIADVPQEACVKIAAQDLGRGLYSIDVNGTPRTAGSATPPPFDPSSAATACSAATNDVTWIFN